MLEAFVEAFRAIVRPFFKGLDLLDRFLERGERFLDTVDLFLASPFFVFERDDMPEEFFVVVR